MCRFCQQQLQRFQCHFLGRFQAVRAKIRSGFLPGGVILTGGVTTAEV
jgi:hypothetical protein